jgi:L-asparaginase II
MARSEPLVRLSRGGLEESFHTGVLVVVENDRPTIVRGDPGRVVFYRSASKPLQALELVRSGAADAFGLKEAEVAIAAGSHSGEPRHLETVRSMLRAAGIDVACLRCGGHRSINPEVAFAQKRDAVPVTPLLSNCSGKHAGMLVTAKHKGAPLETYLDLAHPVQATIASHVATFGEVPPEKVLAGIDGCGAPALAVPMEAMARSIANVASPEGMPLDLAAAARRVSRAMLNHPEMIAGEDRFDTDLMRAAKGRLIAKAGAEGVHVVGSAERRLGLAVKVDDGSDRGYRLVVLEVLRRRGLLDDDAFGALVKKHAPPLITNMAGLTVGRMDVAF